MTQYFAFLRAINVGGRNIKMDQLRQIFTDMGFAHVETFIASGNVIFDSSESNRKALEQTIEAGLQDALGYRVDTFLRTLQDLKDILEYEPFPPEEISDNALYVGFLAQEPDSEQVKALQGFTSDIDFFQVHGNEVYWLCRKSISKSKFSGAKLEKALTMPTTLRTIRTVQRLVAKYA